MYTGRFHSESLTRYVDLTTIVRLVPFRKIRVKVRDSLSICGSGSGFVGSKVIMFVSSTSVAKHQPDLFTRKHGEDVMV